MSEAPSPRNINVIDASQQLQRIPEAGLQLEPVKPGEIADELATDPHLYDPKDPDFTPAAAMTHEPWSLKDYGPPPEATKPEQPTPSIDPVMAHEGGSLDDYKGGAKPADKKPEETDPFKRIGNAVNDRVDELKDEGKSDAEADAQAHDEYWGKIPKSETEKTEDDPFKRIGDAVNQRVDELKDEGKSDADADAQAHDEFWDKGPKPGEQGPGDKDPGTGEKDPGTPERLTSPELEAANAALEEARNELARLRALRESSTFFPFKLKLKGGLGVEVFSKKKLDAAFDAYEQAKIKASKIAVGLLRGEGHSGRELAGLVNYGAMEEVTSLIDAQYNIEHAEIEGKHIKFFYNWWRKLGNQRFSIGTVTKGLIMAGIGAPIGLAAGMVAGPGLAAGAALLAARNVTKGLVGNTIQRNADAKDMADDKRIQRSEQARKKIAEIEDYNDRLALDGLGDKSDVVDEGVLTDMERSQTRDVKVGNVKRAATSMAIAAGSAFLAAWLAAPDTPGTPKPPTPPPGAPKPPYNPNMDRFQGIVTARPSTAPTEFQGFFGDIQPGTPNLPGLDKVNAIWDSYKGQFNPDQSKIFNQLLGRFSTAQGFGNDWLTPQRAAQIADLVKQGNSANDIIGLLGAGPENL